MLLSTSTLQKYYKKRSRQHLTQKVHPNGGSFLALFFIPNL
ncbi:hypothetical protein [Scytonema sp. PRP1]